MALKSRFKDEGNLHVIEWLKNLEQKGFLGDYINEFDNIRTLLFQQEQYLP